MSAADWLLLALLALAWIAALLQWSSSLTRLPVLPASPEPSECDRLIVELYVKLIETERFLPPGEMKVETTIRCTVKGEQLWLRMERV